MFKRRDETWGVQACLATEPQVSVTRNLLQQAPRALFVPQQVQVGPELVDMAAEVDERGSRQDTSKQDHIPIGTIFTLNRELVSEWKGAKGARLPAATLCVPDPLEKRYTPIYTSRIQVYGDILLSENQSALTQGLMSCLDTDKSFGAGDSIEFPYELGENPRLFGRVVAKTACDAMDDPQ